MEKENLLKKMGSFMKGNGNKIKNMEKVSFFKNQDKFIKAHSKMDKKVDMEKKNSKMVIHIKDNIKIINLTEKVCLILFFRLLSMEKWFIL